MDDGNRVCYHKLALRFVNPDGSIGLAKCYYCGVFLQ